MRIKWALFVYTWAFVAFLLWGIYLAVSRRAFVETVIITVCLVLWVQKFYEGMAWPRREDWMDQ